VIRHLISIAIIAILWPAGMGWGQSANKHSGKPGESARHSNQELFDKPEDRRETTSQDRFELGSQQSENSSTLDNNLKSRLKTQKTVKKASTTKKAKNNLITSPKVKGDIFGFNEPSEKPRFSIDPQLQPQTIKTEFEQFVEQNYDDQLFTKIYNEDDNGELFKKPKIVRDDPIINNINKDDYEAVSKKKAKLLDGFSMELNQDNEDE
jgi:hypothetical protein